MEFNLQELQELNELVLNSNISNLSPDRLNIVRALRVKIDSEMNEVANVTDANSSMINKKDWAEFRNTGLFLFINQILHAFGWELDVDVNKDNDVILVYPARVKFRGYDIESTSEAYRKISQYMKKNADDLIDESNM